MKGAVSPAAVGVDIGCFTGDTRVPIASGKDLPLRQLAESGGDCFVYSCTQSGRIVMARKIDIPRPRTLATTFEPHFVDLVHELRDRIHQEHA